MPADVKSYLKGQIELGLRRFIADLEALDDAHRRASPGGIARSPYDMAYEISVVNQEYALRLRGQPAPAPAGFEFKRAPEDFQEMDRAKTSVEAATNGFLAAFDAFSLERIEIPLEGNKATPLGLATAVNRNMHYHDAQLNYIQTLNGDGEVHWP